MFHGFSELLTSLVENDVFTLRAACRSSPVSCAACLSWPLPQPLVLAWLIWGKCHLTRVTPLAMGGWGNAIMLRPINCYLLRQTDKKKKIVYFVMLQLSVFAMICPKHMEKVTRISSQSSSKCFFVCFARVFTWIMFSTLTGHLIVYFTVAFLQPAGPLWPLTPDTNEAFSQFSPKSKSQQIGSSLWKTQTCCPSNTLRVYRPKCAQHYYWLLTM